MNCVTCENRTFPFHAGNTTMLASVYGPIEVKPQKLLIDKAAVEVYYRPKAGAPSKNWCNSPFLFIFIFILPVGVGDRLYESIVRNICETMVLTTVYPRSAVTVNIQEMQNDGEVRYCMIIC